MKTIVILKVFLGLEITKVIPDFWYKIQLTSLSSSVLIGYSLALLRYSIAARLFPNLTYVFPSIAKFML